MTRKSRYGKKTKPLAIRVPIEKESEIKKKFLEILKKYEVNTDDGNSPVEPNENP